MRGLPVPSFAPLLAVVACVGLADLARAQTPTDLLRLIAEQGDETPPAHFRALAKIGTEEAFEASRKAIGHLRKEEALEQGYGSFYYYKDLAALARRSIDFLSGDAMRHRRTQNRLAATRALSFFGVAAAPELEEIVREHKDPLCRHKAVGPLLGILARRDTRDAALLVVQNTDVTKPAYRNAVRKALALFASAEAIEVFLEALAHSKTPPVWRLLLTERIATADGPDVAKALIELLDDEDVLIQQIAIDALGTKKVSYAAKPLGKLLRSRDGAVLRSTIIALTQIRGSDPRWLPRLFSLTQDRNPAARMGAAVGIAEVRSGKAIELLHKLLDDTDRGVRIEAIQQVSNLRRRDSVPILIERLAHEQRRIRGQIAAMLRLITGRDHGESRDRWMRWWEAEGEAFRVPPYEEALAAEALRRDQRAANVSVSSFYGLNVVSDRVCFILDVSGSMKRKARWRSERSRSKEGAGSTKLAVAKHELTGALKGFPDGDWFNVIFFEARVRAWAQELVQMDERSRERSLSFVAEQRANGGTALFDALATALADPRIDTIYVLTDGAPTAGAVTEPGRIRAEIARTNATRKVQINCIAVGQRSRLLQWLARDSGGDYRERF